MKNPADFRPASGIPGRAPKSNRRIDSVEAVAPVEPLGGANIQTLGNECSRLAARQRGLNRGQFSAGVAKIPILGNQTDQRELTFLSLSAPEMTTILKV